MTDPTTDAAGESPGTDAAGEAARGGDGAARDAGESGSDADGATRDARDAATRDARDAAPFDAPPDVGAGLLERDMGPSSSLAHLYRGEIHRMKFWRERLDRTTNWAVIVLAAVLTWAFSDASHPHYVLIGGGVALSLFAVVEGRRFRGYDIWRSRVRTLQRNAFAVGLDPGEEPPDPRWRERLADDYRTPTVKITAEEAIAHRLRRIYLPLLSVLFVAWVVRVTAFAAPPWPGSAAVGAVPGTVVTAGVVVAYAAAVVVACRPRTWHARGELRTLDLRNHD